MTAARKAILLQTLRARILCRSLSLHMGGHYRMAKWEFLTPEAKDRQWTTPFRTADIREPLEEPNLAAARVSESSWPSLRFHWVASWAVLLLKAAAMAAVTETTKIARG